jgi:chromosome partitioning protein
MLRIGFVSQKGGVGKSTLAASVCVAFAGAGWKVKLADFDTKQLTSTEWAARRLEARIEPAVEAQAFSDVAKASAQPYDLVIFDGRPHASAETLQIARASDLIILPCGTSADDLTPQIKLAHELKASGIERERILFALNKTLGSDLAIAEARNWITSAGYRIATNDIPAKTSYEAARNQGRTLTETPYPSLNEKADRLVQELVDEITRQEHTHG